MNKFQELKKHLKNQKDFHSKITNIGLYSSAPRLLEINIDDIELDKDQPRINYNSKYIEELKNSIKANGLIHPITVQKQENQNKYKIIAGHRRFIALKSLGKEVIYAFVKEYDEKSAIFVSLMENISRVDLNKFEIAYILNKILANNLAKNVKELSSLTGLNETYIYRHLNLLSISEKVRKYIEEKQIRDIYILSKIAKIDNENKAIECIDFITNSNLTRNKLLKEIDKLFVKQKTKKINKKKFNIKKTKNKFLINIDTSDFENHKKKKVEELLFKLQKIIEN